MTVTRTLKRGTPGIDRFSPDQLLRTARLFASDPELPTLVKQDSTERRWVELDSSPYLQIWLLAWPAGTSTGWHDHGESAGAFLVVSGSLAEQTPNGRRSNSRTLTADQGRSFGPTHIHNVVNAELGTALSVHLYTPRLTTMTRYDPTPTGLKAKAVDRIGVNW